MDRTPFLVAFRECDHVNMRFVRTLNAAKAEEGVTEPPYPMHCLPCGETRTVIQERKA